MFLLLFIITMTAQANENSVIWNAKSYESACRSENGKLAKISEPSQRTLECKVSGHEKSSVWFDKKTNKMKGWLNRTRNESEVVILDKEFDGAGALKATSYYIRTLGSQSERIQNMFVFDGSGGLLRGNITLGDETYVIAGPGLYFLNGQVSSLEILRKKLSSKFGVSSQLPFDQQILGIWNQQNQSLVDKTPPKKSSTGTN